MYKYSLTEHAANTDSVAEQINHAPMGIEKRKYQTDRPHPFSHTPTSVSSKTQINARALTPFLSEGLSSEA